MVICSRVENPKETKKKKKKITVALFLLGQLYQANTPKFKVFKYSKNSSIGEGSLSRL